MRTVKRLHVRGILTLWDESNSQSVTRRERGGKVKQHTQKKNEQTNKLSHRTKNLHKRELCITFQT